jgi:hypothetical protein
MIQKILLGILISSIIFFNLPTKIVEAEVPVISRDQIMVIEAKESDRRIIILRDYFRKYNSPLEASAQDFIEAADTYNLDWKLVPAIAGVESTFGKHLPGGTDPRYTSYNCWGWGVYGTQALHFKSFRHGIFTVSEGLKKDYIDKGYTNPYSMNRKYAASQTWGTKVSYFLTDIEKFEKNYNSTVELNEVAQVNNLPQTQNLKSKLANNTHQFSLEFVH